MFIEPVGSDFEADLLRYKLRFAYPVMPFRHRFVPCRCSPRWRFAILRTFGRHPRTHRVPLFSVLGIV